MNIHIYFIFSETSGLVRMPVKFPCQFELSDTDALYRRFTPARVTQRIEKNSSVFEFEIPLGTATAKPEYPAKLASARVFILSAWISENNGKNHAELVVSENCELSCSSGKIGLLLKWANPFDVSLAKAYAESRLTEGSALISLDSTEGKKMFPNFRKDTYLCTVFSFENASPQQIVEFADSCCVAVIHARVETNRRIHSVVDRITAHENQRTSLDADTATEAVKAG